MDGWDDGYMNGLVGRQVRRESRLGGLIDGSCPPQGQLQWLYLYDYLWGLGGS